MDSDGSYQQLCAILPTYNGRIVRRNQDTLEYHTPGTVENEEPHRRSQRLSQELVSETGEMRVKARA